MRFDLTFSESLKQALRPDKINQITIAWQIHRIFNTQLLLTKDKLFGWRYIK